MIYTHFKITQFGLRTDVLINGVAAVIGTWYLKTDEIKVVKQNASHLGAPFDLIKYQVTDGNKVSNVANILVNFPPDLLVDPTSTSVIQVILNNTIYDLIDYIPFSNGVDRIKIIGFKNVGELTLNGFPLYNNTFIFHYDFENIKFESFGGIGNGYQTVYYQVGNENGFNPTIYSVRFDINGLSSLIAVSDEEDVDNDDPGITILTKEGKVKVTNGIPFGIAKVNFDLNLSASAWPVSTDNEFIIDYNGLGLNLSNNINTDLFVTLNEFGEGEIDYNLRIDNNDTPVTGTATFELLDIDGNTGIISGTNTVNLTINF